MHPGLSLTDSHQTIGAVLHAIFRFSLSQAGTPFQTQVELNDDFNVFSQVFKPTRTLSLCMHVCDLLNSQQMEWWQEQAIELFTYEIYA